MTFWILLFLVLSFLTTVALLGALMLSKRTIHQSTVVDEEPITMPALKPAATAEVWKLGAGNLKN